MASITFPRKQFEKNIGKLDEKMQDKISMFGTPLEKFDNNEMEIEVFPNRPDLLSYHGFKRSFLAFLGKQRGLKEYKLNKPEKDYIVTVDSSVKDVRPYTACAIVKGLKFDDDKIKELIDIQEKLHLTIGRKRKKVAIGIYPLEKIKLPITFKALEPDKIKFIPLETEREMSGLQILQRHPTGREYSHLLAGKPKFPVFVDSANNILSMPPIINSQLTGKITNETTDVFVECSGADFYVLNKCLNIIVTNLAEMGGKIYQMELKYKEKKITPEFSTEKVKISLQNVNSLLGTNINEKKMKELLEKMGHDYSKGIVEIPPWRIDILHEVDLIEDIAIAYGYENFVPEMPRIGGIGKEDEKEIFKRKIAEIFTGLNMLEVSNYHLTNKEEQFRKMGIQEEGQIKIENSKTDYNMLRKDLSHYLLKILAENVDTEYPQRIFEVGRIFNSLNEEEHLALAISPANFTELRQILEYFSRMLNLEIKFSEIDKIPNYFIDGRTAEILLGEGGRVAGGGKHIGFLGEIHPRVLKNWKIKMPVALFEINLEEVFKKLM
jgi:phenylalanyl-tRNA synthetase beta chain